MFSFQMIKNFVNLFPFALYDITVTLSGTNPTLVTPIIYMYVTTEGGADGGDSKAPGGVEGPSVAFPPEHDALPRLH